MSQAERAAASVDRAELLVARGRYEAAARAAAEAAGIYRDLAAAAPAHRPDLARSLDLLALLYSAVRRPADALAAAVEAVRLYRALVALDPVEFDLSLALSLQSLLPRVMECLGSQPTDAGSAALLYGLPPEAGPAGVLGAVRAELVAVYRRLSAIDPHLHGPALNLAQYELAVQAHDPEARRAAAELLAAREAFREVVPSVQLDGVAYHREHHLQRSLPQAPELTLSLDSGLTQHDLAAQLPRLVDDVLRLLGETVPVEVADGSRVVGGRHSHRRGAGASAGWLADGLRSGGVTELGLAIGGPDDLWPLAQWLLVVECWPERHRAAIRITLGGTWPEDALDPSAEQLVALLQSSAPALRTRSGFVTCDRLQGMGMRSAYERWHGIEPEATAELTGDRLRGYHWANLLTAGQVERIGGSPALERTANGLGLVARPLDADAVLVRAPGPIGEFDDLRLAAMKALLGPALVPAEYRWYEGPPLRIVPDAGTAFRRVRPGSPMPLDRAQDAVPAVAVNAPGRGAPAPGSVDAGALAALEAAGIAAAGCEVVLDWGDGHPVSAVELPAADVEGACDRLREAFDRTGYWPLAVAGGGAAADIWACTASSGGSVVGQAAIDAATDPDLDLDAALRLLHGVEEPAEAAGAPSPDLAPAPGATAVEGVPEPPLQGTVLLVPAGEPWEVLARVGFGDRNLCAGPTLHTALLRSLWTECGGVARAAAGDALVIELGRPPARPEAALRLAERLTWYCVELADGLSGDGEDDPVIAIAARLLGGARRIVLWWD